MASESKAEGLACPDDAFDAIKAQVSEASFSSDKQAFLRTVCQNYVFTTEQVAALLNEFSFGSDKMEAIDVFEFSVSNPSETEPLSAAFDDEDELAEASGKVSGFDAAEVRELGVFPIEDDGHRSEEDMERFLAAIREASMSDDKVAVAETECAEHPSPPFDSDQLIAVLKEFSFSDDAVRVLEAFTGPQIVYPMTCESVVAVLEVFSMSDDKIKVLPFLKPFICDAQNKLTVVSSFTFGSDKEAAEEILRDLVVSFRPKTPPEAEIQAALRRVGSCPSGYAWRQVSGGWRCAAGGHYVSDATLAEAM